jgi:hypothetical protein
VDTPGGRLGFVEEVRRDPVSDRPAELVVRAGMLGTHLLVVPVSGSGLSSRPAAS